MKNKKCNNERKKTETKEKNQLQKTENNQEILLGEHENSSTFIMSFARKNKISPEKMHDDISFNTPKLGYLLE